MKFVWAGERERENTQLVFSLNLRKNCDRLTVCAVDSFQIYVDGKFVCYGPDRTAAGYVRPKQIALQGAKRVEVKVTAFNVRTYQCDKQLPLFGAEACADGAVIYSTDDFICEREKCRLTDVPRYSVQRGFVEAYDFSFTEMERCAPYEVSAPVILDELKERCQYKRVTAKLWHEGIFSGFDNEKIPWWEKNLPAGTTYGVSQFLPTQAIGYQVLDYRFSRERTGFLALNVEAEEETEIILVFDELLPEGKWTYRRSGCNDFVLLRGVKGEKTWVSCEPYALQFLKILYKGKAKITPSLVALENDEANFVEVNGDKKLVAVFEAARNTFRQNALDIFMDCPGRERAGWLCDSYFTAQAELLFTGKNEIEKTFLENFLIGKTPEIPDKMLPKCFPSEHGQGSYIPNWAMWYVLEVEDYLARTGDCAFVERAKETLYGVVEFFEKYVNEYGLLEDLESWVFLEWSVCNREDYIAGVNFPSNMLFARALEAMSSLYGDNALKMRAEKMKQQIVSLSYDGSFFADNAVRKDGQLCRCDEHVSETCQYYALFTGICPDESYRRRMIEDFGPTRVEKYPEIGKSNMFIGNYLRLFWLCEEKEYARVMKETVEYFYTMAEKTGTLWEHDQSKASCNHGFASVIAVLLLRCVVGYRGVRNGIPIFEKERLATLPYSVEVKFKTKEK